MRAFLLLSCMMLAVQAQASETDPVDAAPRPVVSVNITAVPAGLISIIGTVDARVQTDLGFPVIGTIAERPAEIGDQVLRGDLLARLDPQDMEADLRAAQAGVTVAEAELRSAMDADNRARELVQRGVESETRLESADRALNASEARLEQARAALARAEDTRGYAELFATQDGIITEVYAEPGSTLSAGDPVVRLVGTDQREVVIDVLEQNLAAFDVASSFDAALLVNPAIKAHVVLSRIDPVANRSTRTRRVRLRLIDPPTAFRLGALVSLVPADDAAAGISIPQSAILEPDGDAPSVWVVDRSDNSAKRTTVELGETFGPWVGIKGGLAMGDEVILKGIHSITDGQIVGPQAAP
jgi:RND family efflux transporter MFP subunit